jgi:salicylate hydroxylase
MTRVAIIGGGIGGHTAAIALRPNAMRVLRALGLEDGVRKAAWTSSWAATRNGKTGRVITRTSRERQADSFGINGATVHRADLLDVLAAALPPSMVTLGRRCISVTQDLLPQRGPGRLGGRAGPGRR